MPEPFPALTPSAAFVPAAADVPPGVDVDMILAEVSDDGVSAPAAIESDLLSVVQRAEENGIDLRVVVVEKNVGHDSQLRDLATAVGAEDGGTVLVLSPGQVGTFSDSISRVVLESGQDRTYTGDPVLAADNFVDTLVGPHPPWSLLTGLIILAVAGFAAGTAVVKARRRSARPSDHRDEVPSNQP